MAKAARNSADTLRDVAPREFVRARNALAAQLAKSGKSAEARQISRLRRPSPAVWALNNAALAGRRELSALIDAVDRLRRAQLGQGDLRTATERYRAAFEPIAQAASERLREAGTAVSPALERRIRSTLLAAATDRGLRADLAAGHLTDEHAEPGFSVLSQGPIPATFLRDRPAAAPAPAPRRGEPRAEPQQRRLPEPRPDPDERRRTEQGRRDARVAARHAKREAIALERDARRKERVAQAAEARVDAMRKALREGEQRSARLRAAADEARQAHEKRLTP